MPEAATKKKPSVDTAALELASFGRAWSTFQYRTIDALEDVLAPGYFDAALSVGIRVGDVVEILTGAPPINLGGVARVAALGPAIYGKLSIAEIRSPNEDDRVLTACLWNSSIKHWTKGKTNG